MMDEDTLDNLLDPSYVAPRGKIYQTMPHDKGSRNRGFKLVDVYGATIEDLTYRHVDLRSTCIEILSPGGKPPTRLKKPIRSYFQIDKRHFPPAPDRPNNIGHTAVIKWQTACSLSVMRGGRPSCLMCTGLLRYWSNTAYYMRPRDALRAVFVKTLVQVAQEREQEDDVDPAWARKLLPTDRQHAVLYQNGSHSGSPDDLFGFLHFRNGDRVLSVPSDTRDLTQPWEDFVFRDYRRG